MPHPSQQAPRIFDRALGRQRLIRAMAQGSADFLLNRICQELLERLDAIQRDFPAVLDLGTPGGTLAAHLARPGRFIVQARPTYQANASGPTIICDEEWLPFAPASFDLVVSALALHIINDLPGALVQIRRAMRPDGLLLAALPGGQTLHELRTAFAIAESECEDGVSPRVAPFADVRDLGALLQRVGFALPVADVEPLTVRYASMFALMADLRAMGATNTLVDRRKTPLRRKTLLRAAEIYAERFADSDGRVRATFEIVMLSGWVPHENQQKPLAPGSARMRLADALAAQEHVLPREDER